MNNNDINNTNKQDSLGVSTLRSTVALDGLPRRRHAGHGRLLQPEARPAGTGLGQTHPAGYGGYLHFYH